MSLHPSVAVLLSDRLEARELADDLATMLDRLLSQLNHRIEPDFDDVLALENVMQRWSERTWAP